MRTLLLSVCAWLSLLGGGCGAAMSTKFEFHGADRDVLYSHGSSNSDDRRAFSWKETRVMKDGTTVTIDASANAQVDANVAAIQAQGASLNNALGQLNSFLGKITSALPLLGGLGGLGGGGGGGGEGGGGGIDPATLAALIDAFKSRGRPLDADTIRDLLARPRPAPVPMRP